MGVWLIVIWAAVLLATLGGAAYVAYRFSDTLRTLPAQWKNLTPFEGAIAVLGAMVFYVFDYLRLYALLLVMKVKLGVRRGVEVIILSEFASVLTPTAELHMPVSVYALTRMDVPPEKAIAAVSTKTMYGIMWVCVMGLSSLFAFDGVKLPDLVSRNLPYLAIPIVIIATVFFSLTLFSKSIRAWTLRHEKTPYTGRVGGLKKKAVSWIGRSAGAIATIGKSTHPMHLLAHAANVGYIVAYCFVGWWLSYSMNIHLSAAAAFTIFSNSLMIDYLAPVPGSIGITEFVTAYMIDPNLAPPSIVAAVLLRILCKYAVLLPGSFVAINLLRREGLKMFSDNRQQA